MCSSVYVLIRTCRSRRPACLFSGKGSIAASPRLCLNTRFFGWQGRRSRRYALYRRCSRTRSRRRTSRSKPDRVLRHSPKGRLAPAALTAGLKSPPASGPKPPARFLQTPGNLRNNRTSADILYIDNKPKDTRMTRSHPSPISALRSQLSNAKPHPLALSSSAPNKPNFPGPHIGLSLFYKVPYTKHGPSGPDQNQTQSHPIEAQPRGEFRLPPARPAVCSLPSANR